MLRYVMYKPRHVGLPRCVVLGILLALFMIAVAGINLASAQQQPACTLRADVVSHLEKKYSERPVSIGLANNGGVIEVLSSTRGSSWTIIITMPNGTSCMIAAGENWEDVPKLVRLDPQT